METVLELMDIVKSYPTPSGGKLNVLSGLSFSLKKGEIVSIMGRSGSGKSTFLYSAALITSVDEGRILYSGRDVSSLKSSQIDTLRNREMGFVFQNSLLLEDFSALENTAMPLLISGVAKNDAYRRAMECLDILGVSERSDYRPGMLSGGEKQRVAIARAIAPLPSVIFADEPTGSLDESTALDVEDALFTSVGKAGLSMIIVTHNSDLAGRADRTLVLTEGRLRG